MTVKERTALLRVLKISRPKSQGSGNLSSVLGANSGGSSR